MRFQHQLKKRRAPLIFSEHFLEYVEYANLRNVSERNLRLHAVIPAKEIFQVGNVKKERSHRFFFKAFVNKRRHKLAAIDFNVLFGRYFNPVHGEWGNYKYITLSNIESSIADSMLEIPLCHIPNLKIVVTMMG